MLRRLIMPGLVVLVLVGCGGDPVPTATSVPPATNTPTLSEIDLKPLLVQEGDVTAPELTVGPVQDVPVEFYAQLGVPLADRAASQTIIAKPLRLEGFAAASLYADRSDLGAAFNAVVGDMERGGGAQGLPGVGEQAQISTMLSDKVGFPVSVSIVFIRCKALGHVQLVGVNGRYTPLPDDAVRHAKNLDARLRDVVC